MQVTNWNSKDSFQYKGHEITLYSFRNFLGNITWKSADRWPAINRSNKAPRERSGEPSSGLMNAKIGSATESERDAKLARQEVK